MFMNLYFADSLLYGILDREGMMNKLKKEIKELLGSYIDLNTKKPLMESLDKDINVAVRSGELVSILSYLEKNIIQGYEFNECNPKSDANTVLQSLEEITAGEKNAEDAFQELGKIMGDTCNQKCLAPYLNKHLEWIHISILTTHYISAYILMRSTLEFIINLASNIQDGMNAKIDSIEYFRELEKKEIKKLWKYLCAWAHPYNKWTNNICMHYITNTPLYHPKYYSECTSSFESLLDIYLIFSFNHFNINIDTFINYISDKCLNVELYKHTYKRLKERNAV